MMQDFTLPETNIAPEIAEGTSFEVAISGAMQFQGGYTVYSFIESPLN